ncbi:MAG: Radical domain protein [Acidimicrobiales bacterium]|nr:Radical domain protein [Acidimicrobiales bacterium]
MAGNDDGDGTQVITLTRVIDPDPVQVAILRPPWLAKPNAGYLMPTPPVGAGYIAAVLREAGHHVQVIDSPGEAMERVDGIATAAGTIRRIGLPPADMVARIEPGTRLIGITNMFSHEWPTCREIAVRARERFPDATIVVGGENATSMWPWMFEQTDAIDAVVLGEGETTAVEIAARVSAGLPLVGTTGLAVRQGAGGAPETGGLPVRLKKLGTVPRPAWDLFPLEPYFEHKGATGVDRGRSMPLLATRGCPYQCSFCSSPNMWTTRYVVREPEDVADEIEDLVHRYGVRNIDFVDLTPITKRSWTLRLCAEVKRRHLDVSLQLPIGTRSEALDEEVLNALAEAGCTNLTFAPESGSDRMLAVYDKRLDLDRLLDSVAAARRAGLVTNIHMILGHPAETWKDRWLSWKFMMRAAFAGLLTAGTTLFYPYPGSKDFQDLLDAGKITVDDDYCYDSLTRGGGNAINNWNPTATVKTLHRVQMFNVATFMALSHILHPSQMVHLVRNLLLGGEEHTWLEQGLRTKRRGPMSRKHRGAPEPVVGGLTVVPARAEPERTRSGGAGLAVAVAEVVAVVEAARI